MDLEQPWEGGEEQPGCIQPGSSSAWVGGGRGVARSSQGPQLTHHLVPWLQSSFCQRPCQQHEGQLWPLLQSSREGQHLATIKLHWKCQLLLGGFALLPTQSFLYTVLRSDEFCDRRQNASRAFRKLNKNYQYKSKRASVLAPVCICARWLKSKVYYSQHDLCHWFIKS